MLEGHDLHAEGARPVLPVRPGPDGLRTPGRGTPDFLSLVSWVQLPDLGIEFLHFGVLGDRFALGSDRVGEEIREMIPDFPAPAMEEPRRVAMLRGDFGNRMGFLEHFQR